MVGWHHRFNGHESEQAPGDGEGQESLVCCSPRGCKESDTTERLSNNQQYIYTESRKMVLMNLFGGQEQRCRCREWTCAPSGGRLGCTERVALTHTLSESRSVVSDSATPWTAACQAPLFNGILEARILEQVAVPFSRGSSHIYTTTCKINSQWESCCIAQGAQLHVL